MLCLDHSGLAFSTLSVLPLGEKFSFDTVLSTTVPLSHKKK